MPRRWWDDETGERYWMEVSDRGADLGVDLNAPTTNEVGGRFWSYDLLDEVGEGDVILHYDRSEHAILAWSLAVGAPWLDEVVWAARGTYARGRNIQPHPRPGRRVSLAGPTLLQTPVTLARIRGEQDRLVAIRGERPYFPFELGSRPARPMQGYLFKLPAAFLDVFPELDQVPRDFANTRNEGQAVSDFGLVSGRTYGWGELADRFDFSPGYFSLAGGMISRPELGALLLITYPGGAKSFDYDDYWDGDALIYTGRGKRGDQQFAGQNYDLAENVRTNFVFEGGVGSGALRYLGTAQCHRHWKARGLGDDGVERDIIRYRLVFTEGGRRSSPRERETAAASAERQTPHRARRPFDPSREPASYSAPVHSATPEETAALQEKVNRAHHDLLVRLQDELWRRGFTDVVEIPGAVDLEASGDGRRVIFEAKVLSETNELSRTRVALAQLLEYRYFYGEPDSALCLVTTRPISDRRLRFLEDQLVAVAYDDGSELTPCGTLAPDLLETSAR